MTADRLNGGHAAPEPPASEAPTALPTQSAALRGVVRAAASHGLTTEERSAVSALIIELRRLLGMDDDLSWAAAHRTGHVEHKMTGRSATCSCRCRHPEPTADWHAEDDRHTDCRQHARLSRNPIPPDGSST